MKSTSEASAFGLPDAFSSARGDLSLLTAFEDLAGHFAWSTDGPSRCAKCRTIVAFGRLTGSSPVRYQVLLPSSCEKSVESVEQSFGTVTPASAWGLPRTIGLTDGTDFRDARTADFVGFRFRPETHRLRNAFLLANIFHSQWLAQFREPEFLRQRTSTG